MSKLTLGIVPLVFLQIAQIDMLTKLGLKPDGIVGHSVGELACGYADGSLSLKEAVLAAYWRGRCIKEASLPPGGMAAVGKWIFFKNKNYFAKIFYSLEPFFPTFHVFYTVVYV